MNMQFDAYGFAGISAKLTTSVVFYTFSTVFLNLRVKVFFVVVLRNIKKAGQTRFSCF